MVNSRNKGKRGELEAVRVLRAHGIPARRGRQYTGGGDSPDVVHALAPVLHVEVKFTQRLLIDDWYDQAVVDGNYRLPVVLHRRATVGGRPPLWICTTAVRDLALVRGARHPADFEDGSAEKIADLARAVLAVDLDCTRTDALRFDDRFRMAMDRPPQQPALPRGLAHCRKPADSLWMVSMRAQDFIPLVVDWATREFGWKPAEMMVDRGLPVAPHLSPTLEQKYRRWWLAKGKLAAIERVFPLYR